MAKVSGGTKRGFNGVIEGNRTMTPKQILIDKDQQGVINFMIKTLGYSEKEAKDAYSALAAWRTNGFSSVREWQLSSPDDIIPPPNESRRANILEKYVNDAPKYSGSTYRGIGSDEILKLEAGSVYEAKALASWSSDKETAIKYMKHNGGGVVLRVKKPQNGTPIEFRQEIVKGNVNEILTTGKSRYVIKGVSKENGVTFVDLEPIKNGKVRNI